MSFYQKVSNVAHSVGEMVTPVLKLSAFQERGVLTPDEFVAAGDQLTRTCPTWEWCAGDARKRRSYLPPEKQFLITRGVTCEHRASYIEDSCYEVELQGVQELGDHDTWLGTHTNRVARVADDDDALDMASTIKQAKDSASRRLEEQGLRDKDNFVDLDDFVEEDIANPNSVQRNGGSKTRRSDDDETVAMRTYDVSITYDKYYRTPRIWLMGYDEQQRPLSGKEQMEDIMREYINKTVTIEPHPVIAGNSASYTSIHPCKHADVMKKIVSMLAEGGKAVEPRQYLFLFLKFIQSVIPTINYDNTIEVQGTVNEM